jgi:hypothetical protein
VKKNFLDGLDRLVDIAETVRREKKKGERNE